MENQNNKKLFSKKELCAIIGGVIFSLGGLSILLHSGYNLEKLKNPSYQIAYKEQLIKNYEKRAEYAGSIAAISTLPPAIAASTMMARNIYTKKTKE